MKDFAQWDNVELLRQFEQRLALEKTLVRWLYKSVVHGEIEAIGQEAIRRTTFHPNWWREKGIVHTSWTDHVGLVHNPFFGQCPAIFGTPWLGHSINKHDQPAKEFTCLWCLATGSGSTG